MIKHNRIPILLFPILLSLLLFFALGEAAPQSVVVPQKLAVYYGLPSEVNGADDVGEASAEFAPFDHIILGDGYQHPTHTDYTNTQLIIDTLIMSGTAIYGYVDMGVNTQNLPLATAQQYVDEWQTLGVTGIFWDNTGYDAGTNRVRQSALIDYTHAQGLTAFVTATNPDDIFAVAGMTPTPLQAGDWFLATNHPVADGDFADLGDWWTKSQSLTTYRTNHSVNIATLSTGSDSFTGWANQEQFRQTLWATYLFGFDAYAFTNDTLGASNERLRPLPTVATDVGINFLTPPTLVNATTYSRTTDTGTIVVYGDDNAGGGTFYNQVCDTRTIGSAIWPDCANAPSPHSSPYGPRQRASSAFRYDWHRGGDIPQPLGEPVYAMMDGIVRLAGDSSGYSDMVIQLRHRTQSPYLYTNVLHMNSVIVNVGDLVTVGDLVGYSGESTSGFDHMHYEVRDGCLFQECNRNPWAYLPYDDTPPIVPTLAGANLAMDQTVLLIDASTPDDQLDFDGIRLDWSQPYTVSFHALNLLTVRDFPEGMDHPVQPLGNGAEACIFPERFTTGWDSADYRFALTNLPPQDSGTVAGLDVHNVGTPTAILANPPAISLTPATNSVTATAGTVVTFSHTIQNDIGNATTVTVTAKSAQNNPIQLSQSNFMLGIDESANFDVGVTLSAPNPTPIGDCILVEIDAGTGQTVIAVNQATTTDAPPTAVAMDGADTTPRMILPLLLIVFGLLILSFGIGRDQALNLNW